MQFTTLNQVINKLEAIQQSHAQLNGFGFGEDFELSTQQENYPLMWVNVLSSSITDKTLSLGIGVLILDIVADDNSNEKDILSDTLSICQDVYSMLMNPNNTDEFELSNTVTLNPLFEAFPDKVNGWRMDLTIELPYEKNRCFIPLK